MIAVDTNILVYDHREDSAWHAASFSRLAELAQGQGHVGYPVALPARISHHRNASRNL